MSENSSKCKRKKKSSILLVGIVLIIAVVIIAVLRSMVGGGTNYLTITDNLLSNSTGCFRYVFDIRTDKHTESSNMESVSNLADLENLEADMDVDKILEEYQQSSKEFVEWGNKEGIEVIDWKYPKYKIIIEGNVKSKEPLEMNMSISLATNYFNDYLTDIIVKDNITYLNIEQLRYWLINSKDSNLINLGMSLPESSKYIMYKGDAFNLYSTFAETSELDKSRESSISNLYDRLLVAGKVIASKLVIPEKCLSEENDIYKFNMVGEDAVSLLRGIKSIVLNIGGTYSSIVENQKNNNLLSDEQYKQAKRESDNISLAFSDLCLFLNTADLSAMDLQMSGNARTYIGGKGTSIYESSLAFQFTADDTDYSIAIQLQKDSNTNDVKEPTQSTVDIETFKDKDFVQKSMVQVLSYLNITGVDLYKQLEITPASIKDNAMDSFIELVNQVNNGVEGFTEVNSVNIIDYIDNYRNFKVDDKTSDLDALNSTLVSDFLAEFEDLLPDKVRNENSSSTVTIEDLSRFPNLVSENSKFRIYANFDNDNSNTRCISVKCYILNKSSKELKLNSSDFTLRTIQSSKYPANYKSILKEYDNDFNMKKAPEKVTIPAGGYAEVPLYFVISNGIEYMDLWYGEKNLGVVINH